MNTNEIEELLKEERKRHNEALTFISERCEHQWTNHQDKDDEVICQCKTCGTWATARQTRIGYPHEVALHITCTTEYGEFVFCSSLPASDEGNNAEVYRDLWAIIQPPFNKPREKETNEPL